MESATQTSCLRCIERPDRLFCHLPAEALKAFDALKSTIECTKGDVLFREGSPCIGVFVLCEGRARLSVCSESGSRLTLRIAAPGEMLGLSACLAGSHYGMTAELLDSSRVATMKYNDLMTFLREHEDACMQVVNLLSQDLHYAYERVRAVGLGKHRRARSLTVN
ncbi:MAG TPA: cyclic nucleotide-binding domain-containing protein [Terriglobales bacterium]